FNVLNGKANALIKSHRTDQLEFFGWGQDKEASYWMALLRQLLVAGYLRKEIETYGIIHVTEKGKRFIEKPVSFMMTEDHSFDEEELEKIDSAGSNGEMVDEGLFKLLKAQLKKEAHKLNLPPYVIFQEPSLEDMALKYPVTI